MTDQLDRLKTALSRRGSDSGRCEGDDRGHSGLALPPIVVTAGPGPMANNGHFRDGEFVNCTGATSAFLHRKRDTTPWGQVMSAITDHGRRVRRYVRESHPAHSGLITVSGNRKRDHSGNRKRDHPLAVENVRCWLTRGKEGLPPGERCAKLGPFGLPLEAADEAISCPASGKRFATIARTRRSRLEP